MSQAFVRRDDALGRGLRQAAQPVLCVADELSARKKARQQRRKEAERRRWMKENSRPARIYTP